MATFEEHAKKRDVKGMMLTAIITALSFVVGLFWNDAIRAGIEQIIPLQQRVSAKFLAAIFVTLLVIVVGYLIIRTTEIGETAGKELQRRRIEFLEKKVREEQAKKAKSRRRRR